jgi:hypothetical protein
MTIWKNDPLINSSKPRGLKQIIKNILISSANKIGLIRRDADENKFIQISIE